MQVINAEVKLEEGGFNNMPAREVIMKELDLRIVPANIVDVDGLDYWKNASDTLVLATDRNNGLTAATIGKIAVEMGADEFDWKMIDQRLVFRLWWD